MRLPDFAPAGRARALRVAAALTLLVGYGDLVLGGMTVGPLMLVLGYGVLIPAVILA